MNALQAIDLLNLWQRDFPLEREPFARLADRLGCRVVDVLAACERARDGGALSRIGGVFGTGAGGAALLAAMAVPPERLEAVAALVSSHPGVNHNYQRDHRLNLWFVMTGRDAAAVEQAMLDLERRGGLPALRLRMRRAYRIDLGFDLRHRTAPGVMPPAGEARPIAAADLALAARVEEGLPLVPRPFDVWAEALGRPVEAVLDRLRAWLAEGTLKRFGAIVRHHELGFDANAMAVFDLPDTQVDLSGELLAREPGVTLAYCRERAPGWPYNLYAMVHGRDRAAVHEVLERVGSRCALAAHPQAVLFSTRRFKQTGARRFRDLPAIDPSVQEVLHAVS